jgi:hypothetical protein
VQFSDSVKGGCSKTLETELHPFLWTSGIRILGQLEGNHGEANTTDVYPLVQGGCCAGDPQSQLDDGRAVSSAWAQAGTGLPLQEDAVESTADGLRWAFGES